MRILSKAVAVFCQSVNDLSIQDVMSATGKFSREGVCESVLPAGNKSEYLPVFLS